MSGLFHWILIFVIGIPAGKAIAKMNLPKSNGWSGVWIKGALISLALGGFSYITTGQPTCITYDAMFGVCEEYADNEFSWTHSRAFDRGLSIFLASVLVGTTGMFLLKREKDAKGGQIFVDHDTQARILANNKEAWKEFLEILRNNIAIENHLSGEFKEDYERCDYTGRKVLKLLRRGKLKTDEAEMLDIFYAARNRVQADAAALGTDISKTMFS